MEKTQIAVEVDVNASIDQVWECWTNPDHITKWCQASDDWHAPFASNDLRNGGKFVTTMAAKDGSASFDFEGIYSTVIKNELIEYEIADGRKVSVQFSQNGNSVHIKETFETENFNPVEMQRGGWQAILDNFKKYTEAIS